MIEESAFKGIETLSKNEMKVVFLGLWKFKLESLQLKANWKSPA